MLTKPSPHFFTLLIVQASSTQPNTCHLTSTNHGCLSKQLNDAQSAISPPLEINFINPARYIFLQEVRLKKGTCAYVWFLCRSHQQHQQPLSGSHATLKTPIVPPKLHTLTCIFLHTWSKCPSCVFVQIASLKTPPSHQSLTP